MILLNDKAARVEKIVQELKQLPAVIDAILLGRDGIVIAPAREKESHLKRFGAICAALTGAADAALSRYYGAGPESIVVKGRECGLIVVDAGPTAILMVLSEDLDILEDLTVLGEMKSSRIRDLLA